MCDTGDCPLVETGFYGNIIKQSWKYGQYNKQRHIDVTEILYVNMH